MSEETFQVWQYGDDIGWDVFAVDHTWSAANLTRKETWAALDKRTDKERSDLYAYEVRSSARGVVWRERSVAEVERAAERRRGGHE